MGGTYRPMYDADVAAFSLDTTSPWATMPGVTAAVTATNFQYVGGAAFWSIQVIPSLSAGITTPLVVQVNNSNPIVNAGSTAAGSFYIPYAVNPLMNSPNWRGAHRSSYINSGFTANWTSIGIVSSITAFSIPARFVRLVGLGATAGAVAYLWTDGMSQGN